MVSKNIHSKRWRRSQKKKKAALEALELQRASKLHLKLRQIVGQDAQIFANYLRPLPKKTKGESDMMSDDANNNDKPEFEQTGPAEYHKLYSLEKEQEQKRFSFAALAKSLYPEPANGARPVDKSWTHKKKKKATKTDDNDIEMMDKDNDETKNKKQVAQHKKNAEKKKKKEPKFLLPKADLMVIEAKSKIVKPKKMKAKKVIAKTPYQHKVNREFRRLAQYL
eukprot:GEZU01022652.1.p1 GENE.GEZU01022652.1~~GEZU01022652.1.p1  ORF type:complete len:223 (-),score=69.55 GEZU01022652.1:146-814(-)